MTTELSSEDKPVAESSATTVQAPSPEDSEQPMIQSIDLRVDYQELTAVQDLNLSIPAGVVYGLIGPNGAGKSSTIRVLAALQRPTYGDVFIQGIDVLEHPKKAHRIIGYMPDMPPVYEDLKVWEYLALYAGMYQLPKSQHAELVEKNLNRVSLWEKRNAKAGNLSRGMTQRLVLAKTLMHDPMVLLLDEPASGLDPIARIELCALLKSLAEEGKTILISSHILTELSGMCSMIGVMQKGHLILHGLVDDIIRDLESHREIMVRFSTECPQLHTTLADYPGVLSIHDLQGLKKCINFDGTDAEVQALLRHLIQEDLPVLDFHHEQMNLEDIILKIGAKEVS